MAKTLQGRFRPSNPQKYKGDCGNILYRSSWEHAFMKWCDDTDAVKSWMSEERAIWYYNPVQKKKCRYFPDFIVQYMGSDGIIREEVVEIKPQKQVDGPPRNPKRRTKAWANAVQTYMVNQAKWKAAADWASDRGMSFRLLTEKTNPSWTRGQL